MTEGEFVYRCTYLHQADMVAEALERAGVAFYRAEEGPGSARWAMPIAPPPAALPGSAFLVIVPGPHAARARRIVASLPVPHEGD